jgi:hypothetical protein
MEYSFEDRMLFVGEDKNGERSNNQKNNLSKIEKIT